MSGPLGSPRVQVHPTTIAKNAALDLPVIYMIIASVGSNTFHLH